MPKSRLVVTYLEIAREVQDLALELAARVELAADGALAGVAVDVLDEASVRGGDEPQVSERSMVAPGASAEAGSDCPSTTSATAPASL